MDLRHERVIEKSLLHQNSYHHIVHDDFSSVIGMVGTNLLSYFENAYSPLKTRFHLK